MYVIKLPKVPFLRVHAHYDWKFSKWHASRDSFPFWTPFPFPSHCITNYACFLEDTHEICIIHITFLSYFMMMPSCHTYKTWNKSNPLASSTRHLALGSTLGLCSRFTQMYITKVLINKSHVDKYPIKITTCWLYIQIWLNIISRVKIGVL